MTLESKQAARSGSKLGKRKTKNAQSNHEVYDLQEVFACGLCKKSFSSKACLVVHMKRLHGTSWKKFQCSECGKCFNAKQALKTHLIVHTNKRRCRCEECGMTYCYKRSLVRHKMSHSRQNKKRHLCEACGLRFTEYVELRRHKVVLHPYEEECTVCKIKFSDRCEWTQHMKHYDAHKPFSCSCGKRFLDMKLYIRHQKHRREHCDNAVTLRHSCNVCHTRFTSHKRLDNYKCGYHAIQINKPKQVQEHSYAKRLFLCPSCGKHFFDMKQHKYQNKEHCDDVVTILLSCDFCCDALTSQRTLGGGQHAFPSSQTDEPKCTQEHHGTHKSYSCSCGKQKPFERHKKRNCDNIVTLPLICEFCHGPFMSQRRLDRHKRLFHSSQNDKPTQTQSRRKGERSSKDINNGQPCADRFPCWMCNGVFDSEEDLQAHVIASHSGDEKKILCLKCKMMFPTLVSLKLHVCESLSKVEVPVALIVEKCEVLEDEERIFEGKTDCKQASLGMSYCFKCEQLTPIQSRTEHVCTFQKSMAEKGVEVRSRKKHGSVQLNSLQTAEAISIKEEPRDSDIAAFPLINPDRRLD